jgi:transposase InsO family protein
MMDIYSRYIVGAHVHAHESGVLAEELMKRIFGVHGVPAVVHADRGTSMTSKSVATLLADLGVVRSHSTADGWIMQRSCSGSRWHPASRWTLRGSRLAHPQGPTEWPCSSRPLAPRSRA